MADGAYAVHKEIRTKLEEYIHSQYFGKSPILKDAVKKYLDQEGILYKKPFIEASPAYKTFSNGWEKIKIPVWMKSFFLKLSDANLGVYRTPFVHQLDALEAAVCGKDIFVATGTGSGKTECFMWPLLAKLAGEARERKSDWNQRGVRTIIMYPMNALVSDQVSRLRRLMGDREGKFETIFHEICGNVRRPQFGMYTGRTPYPGTESSRGEDKKVSKTFEPMLIQPDDTDSEKEFKEKMYEDGRVPAKKDLSVFIERLSRGDHTPDPRDAELVTRFEMQKCTPDILITNYSMLEYMIIRQREQNIWNDTKRWLKMDKKNRLLFIIDEAHLYRGSAGGEVALLLRRLFHKLGIMRDQIQFILTTASMPKEDKKSVDQFFNDLTAGNNQDYCFLQGEKDDISGLTRYDIGNKHFNQVKPNDFETSEKLESVNRFWTGVKGSPAPFENLSDASQWMYDHLIEYKPFHTLIEKCRGEAISLEELAHQIFPDMNHDEALMSLGVLLAITPFARDKTGSVLFPARMHMLFKGINGVYACTNENCPHHHADHGITLGEIHLSDENIVCPYCGSQVYELYNDRRCGALFFSGYVLCDEIDGKPSNLGITYLWHNPGVSLGSFNKINQIFLYISPEGVVPKSSRDNPIHPCYLDVKSGFINFIDDKWKNRENVRKLYYCLYKAPGRPDEITFTKCPHCEHALGMHQLTPFSTRGNQSFYNLIKAQFQLEPPVLEKSGNPDKYPNEGRKVLLFSDSRQRAAKLARDMSEASDIAAVRELFALGIHKMNESEDEKSLNELYGYLCLEAAQRHLHLFHGDDARKFKENCNAVSEQVRHRASRERRARRERSRQRSTIVSISKTFGEDAPNQMKMALLRLYCGRFNTLYDTAVSWLEPITKYLDDALDILEDNGISCNDDDFIDLFNAWVMDISDKRMALGHSIPDDLRMEIRAYASNGYGLEEGWKFSKNIMDIMGWEKTTPEMLVWKSAFETFLESGLSNQKYLNLNTIKPCMDENHTWYRCSHCSEITPYTLKKRCPWCGSDDIHSIDLNNEAMEFWHKPLEAVLNGGPIYSIDTEEHTAQLSHKDQRNDIWSRTEQYELRFEDLVKEDELPVDILSSTTTMEVGIDIGSLVAVGLRNIPPTRANYQQRAGRAGRRGSTLSTIVTFCEDGPHDTLYFKNPEPMLRGEPRSPWIDIHNARLVKRHLNMVAIQSYMETINNSMVDMKAIDFLTNELNRFRVYLKAFQLNPNDLILPNQIDDISTYKEDLMSSLEDLFEDAQKHPELYGTDDDQMNHAKSLLDALYEEGIVPTYSFPKNVVSTFIPGSNGKLEYQVERGLDIAIGDFAPGRALVVDKQTYQIGGLYYRGSEWKNHQKDPARGFIEDPNYMKNIVTCDDCGWFGLEKDGNTSCPFCGNPHLRKGLSMLKPWGFAPVGGKSTMESQLQERYTYAQQPLYSTLPESEDMHKLAKMKHIRMAARTNQRIIMLNRGVNQRGFMVCPDCGAAMPGNDPVVLKNIPRPYRIKGMTARCSHPDAINVNLGYDFLTDMLVFEFELDPSVIDTSSAWCIRAPISFAEALRLAACRLLDIDFNELVSGYRKRTNNRGKLYLDVFLYDSLSSGAGYAASLQTKAVELMTETEKLLLDCDCDDACHKCLKHYGNQHVQQYLDRFAALELLRWGVKGEIAPDIPFKKQREMMETLADILLNMGHEMTAQNGNITIDDNKRIVVYPAMKRTTYTKGVLYLSDEMVKYNKPQAMEEIKKACHIKWSES